MRTLKSTADGLSTGNVKPRSLFARKLFILFMLVGLLPACVVALIAIQQVRQNLTLNAAESISTQGKIYANDVIGRLVRLRGQLSDLHTNLNTAGADKALLAKLENRFEWTVVLPASKSAEVLTGSPPQAIEFPPVGERPVGLGKASIFFISQTERTQIAMILATSNGWIVGAPGYVALWEPEKGLDHRYAIRIFTSNGTQLFSSDSTATVNPLEIFTKTLNDGREFSWEDRGSTHLASARSLFLDAEFGIPSFTVVASRSEDRILAPLHNFYFLFGAVALLVLLLATGVCSWQVRKRTQPILSLVQGTRRISAGDYGATVPVASNDEFAELGNAFNTMTRKIDQQMCLLGALSEIDQAMGEAECLDDIAQLAVPAACRVLGHDRFSMSLIERPKDRSATTWFKGKGKHVASKTDKASLVNTFNQVTSDQAIVPSKSAASMLFFGSHVTRDATRVVIYPVRIAKEEVGHLAIGLLDGETIDDDQREKLCEFADRIGVAHGMVNRKRELHKVSNFDDVTHLPNRNQFKASLGGRCKQNRHTDKEFAVIVLDAEILKRVSDSMGQAAGEAALEEVAERIASSFRASDTVACIGGDEFALVLPDVNNADSASRVCSKLLDTLTAPVSIGNLEVIPNPAIGVALYPQDGATEDELLRNASTAARAAQLAKGRRIQMYDAEMNAHAVEQISLETDLRRALKRNELVVYFQPIVNIETQLVDGAEALVRWQHPTRGMIPPDCFIELAERTGLIEGVGDYVLREAIHQHQRFAGRGILLEKVSVNISARQFLRPDFARYIEDILDETEFQSRHLELEVTESLLMDNQAHTRRVIERLRMRGIKFSIDDFGTGYSSLAYLMDMDVDTVKIDRAFTSRLQQDSRVGHMIKAIVQMCNSLEKHIITEGVESDYELSFLRSLNCRAIQGWYFSKALPPDEFIDYALQFNRAKSSTVAESA